MASQTAGIVSMAVDGLYLDVASDCTYSPNSFTREGLVGQSGVQGYKTMPVFGEVTATLRDTGTVNPILFQAMTGVTVTVQLANGNNVAAVDAFCSGVQKINSAEATFEVTFQSSNVAVF
jgi:hypothetical protein